VERYIVSRSQIEIRESSLPEGRPARLLTTRWKTLFALIVTAYLLWLGVHGPLHLGHTESGSLRPLDSLLHGWPLIAVNVALYLYLCWVAFWFIRGTEGRERLFLAGWLFHLILWPVERLSPRSATTIQYLGMFGLVVALFAAVWLLLRPAPPIGDVVVVNSRS